MQFLQGRTCALLRFFFLHHFRPNGNDASIFVTYLHGAKGPARVIPKRSPNGDSRSQTQRRRRQQGEGRERKQITIHERNDVRRVRWRKYCTRSRTAHSRQLVAPFDCCYFTTMAKMASRRGQPEGKVRRKLLKIHRNIIYVTLWRCSMHTGAGVAAFGGLGELQGPFMVPRCDRAPTCFNA